ncbi:pectin lyase fold/virulence factor [Mycena pura]|uniref:galacturonan 1,4-alpha-galacturonidase n=1 Tax=Mycena pura TaxID=153505 RepID=A0AAD6Y8U6_9AGAR|nr:pectin lyase fold/virulence factor [Mycena pura]
MRLTIDFLLGLSALQSAFAHAPSRTVQNVGRASCTLTALGSGKDDSPQFLTAMQACSTVVIPATTTLNISTRLNMTGLTNKHLNAFPFAFQTSITFWILGGTNIVVDGGGTIDGAGQAWYDAFAKSSSLLRPITMTLFQATNVLVQNIKMINSPIWFNFVNEGKNVTFNNVTLNAASTSSNGPANTDGWDTYRSDTVFITNSVINNGDDCAAKDSTNIFVANLNCTGSQSLGQFAGMFDIVENVTATNIHMSNAQNGARIKCWAGSGVGSGIVKNITFNGFIESKVDNPVIIDQCASFPSNTLIQDVFFNNISGTSTGSTVANVGCSPDGRCSDINVNNLNLAPSSGTAKFTCQNIKLAGNSASLFGTCATT